MTKTLTIDMLSMMFALAAVNFAAAIVVPLGLRLGKGPDQNTANYATTKFFQGLSWAVRIFIYLGAPRWINPAVNALLVAGFVTEMLLYTRFKVKMHATAVLSSSAIATAVCMGIAALDGTGIDNLLVLVLYQGSMIAVAIVLWFKKPVTALQRLVAAFYAFIPPLSTTFYVLAGKQVTVAGTPTDPIGHAYYMTILLMQVIGLVSYPLLHMEQAGKANAKAATSS